MSKFGFTIKKILALIILICLIAGGFSLAYWPISEPSQQTLSQHKANNQTNNTDKDPALSEPLTFMDWATFAIAVITAGLLYTSYELIRQGRNTSQRQLRAYIHMDTINCTNPLNHGRLRFKAVIKNFGLTPALSVRSTIQATPPIPNKDAAFKLILENRPVTLGPTGRMELTVETQEISETELASIRNKEKSIFISGIVAYIDVFGDFHTTKFSSVYTGESVLTGLTRPTNQGNEAD